MIIEELISNYWLVNMMLRAELEVNISVLFFVVDIKFCGSIFRLY